MLLNPKGRMKWKVFGLTYLAYAVLYVSRKSFSVVKTSIKNDLGVSTFVLGTIDTVFLTTYAVFQLFLPALSDNCGVRPILVVAFFFAAVFCFTFSLSSTPTGLIYSWLFEGICHAPIFAVLVKTMSLWFTSPVERGRVLGFWTTSQQTGGMAATALATFMSTNFGWRLTFGTAAVATAAVAALLYHYLPEPPEFTLLNSARDNCDNSSDSTPTTTTTSAEQAAAVLATATAKNEVELAVVQKSATKRRSSPPTSSLVDKGGSGGGRSVEDSGGTAEFCALQQNNPFRPPATGTPQPGSNGASPSDISSNNNNLSSNYDNNGNSAQQSPLFEAAQQQASSTLHYSAPIGRSLSLNASPLNSPPVLSSVEIKNPTTTTTSTQKPMRFLDVLRIPHLLACGVSYFCVKVVRYALLLWLPYYLITEKHFSVSLAGYSSMLFDIGGVVGAIASGYASEKLFRGRRLLAAASMSIATAFILALLARTSLQGASVGLAKNQQGHATTAAEMVLVQMPFTATGEKKDDRNNEVVSVLDLNNGSGSNDTVVVGSGTSVGFLSTSFGIEKESVANLRQSKNTSNIARRRLVDQHAADSQPPPSVTRKNLPGSILSPSSPDFSFGWRIFLLMALVGCFIAGPDSILGATAAGDICDRTGNTSAQMALSTATGIVNGLGSLGGVVQGYLVAALSDTWGWPAVFASLCMTALLSVLVLVPALQEDWRSLKRVSWEESRTHNRYGPIGVPADGSFAKIS